MSLPLLTAPAALQTSSVSPVITAMLCSTQAHFSGSGKLSLNVPLSPIPPPRQPHLLLPVEAVGCGGERAAASPHYIMLVSK